MRNRIRHNTTTLSHHTNIRFKRIIRNRVGFFHLPANPRHLTLGVAPCIALRAGNRLIQL